MGLESITNLGFGGQHLNDALPKVLAELQGLSTSVVQGTSAAAAIAVTGIETEDTIVAALAFGGEASPGAVLSITDLKSSLTIADRRAFGTLTIATTLADGDKVVVNGKTYTFKAITVTKSTNLAPRIVPITITPSGVVVNTVALALANAIMSNDTKLTCTVSSGVVTIFYRTAGTAGNAITLSVTDSGGHVTRSGATFTGGTATNSISFSGDTTNLIIVLLWFNKQ